MYKVAFSGFTDSNLIVIGFMLFMGTFLGSFFWTIFIQKKEFYKKLSELPMQDGDLNGRE